MALMELTFWHKGKAPGEVIDVPDPNNPRWRGFAKPLPEPTNRPAEPRMAAEPKTTTTKTTPKTDKA